MNYLRTGLHSLTLLQPVRVTPESYCLFDAAVAGVPELCDAFKVRCVVAGYVFVYLLTILFRHLHQSQNLAGAGAGAKTPYGAGSRTPARTSGHVTPGHMSVRQVHGRTPNPYGGQTPAPPSAFGSNVPSSSYGMQPPFGYQTPAYPPPPQPVEQYPPMPAGMNPQRAAMIQDSGGWSQAGW